MKSEVKNPTIIENNRSTNPKEIEISSETIEKYYAEVAESYGAVLPETGEVSSFSAESGNISGVFGYHSVSGTNNTCGPACMGTIMDFYGFGWSEIPRESDGHYNNDAYIRQIMRWSGAPDVVGGLFGTSPMRIVESMKRLSFQSTWYANGNSADTLNTIKREIDQGRPVYVLVDLGKLGHHFVLDWQVVCGYDSSGVICKITSGRNHTYKWGNAIFEKLLENNIPYWNRTFITVRK